jgi:hypothetical protein
MDPAWGAIVARVWRHFLVERYREWVIAGAGGEAPAPTEGGEAGR